MNTNLARTNLAYEINRLHRLHSAPLMAFDSAQERPALDFRALRKSAQDLLAALDVLAPEESEGEDDAEVDHRADLDPPGHERERPPLASRTGRSPEAESEDEESGPLRVYANKNRETTDADPDHRQDWDRPGSPRNRDLGRSRTGASPEALEADRAVRGKDAALARDIWPASGGVRHLGLAAAPSTRTTTRAAVLAAERARAAWASRGDVFPATAQARRA
jgi:hypothetical protein